ncbi:glycoside hydrolase family 30 protein [Ceratobasidium sp. AG-Ba]|nr:glycoside hydrolase family 30 protein [Ceratobasidium sp. AG-Ba]
MRVAVIFTILAGLRLVVAQTIYDIWQTTWDRTKLLTRTSDPVINFVTKGAIGDADIVVGDTTIYQQMDGFGATLTDSSALVLSQLKSKNLANYNALLAKLFDPTDGSATAGFGVLRLSLGASDFSASAYSFDDSAGDTSLANFSLDRAPAYLWSTLKDIFAVNPRIKLYVLPWSPPAWMKSPVSMNGGTLQSQYNGVFAQYLLKAVQQLKAKGFTVYAVSAQNEPENPNTTYPTTSMPYTQEAAIAQALRPLLNNNGFSSVKIIGGAVANQDTFHNAFPNKEVHMTECSGTIGTDWWSDIKWYMDNIAIGAPQHWSRTGMMWNVASNPSGGPLLPGTNSCNGAGCRAIVTINNDGSYILNQEFYAFAQASRAIVPKDSGGPTGQRIGVSVGGEKSWALRVNAFVTKRTDSADWNRYSLVVLNWNDNAITSWNPQPVKATIEFRGVQATYTFPVGVTTLWWFAQN